ncbi:MAG: uroporphyrinogen-III synthase [Xanthomonadales bacterium]|nr:uroporphyrinogen-III synthase [Xanthomonadales bacterium]
MNPVSATRLQPLAGATVVITRPAGEGVGFARQARALGAATVLLPGLSLRAPEDPERARRQLRGDFDDWIFVSPLAVRQAFALAPLGRLADGSRAFGVGEGTRRALARRGVPAIAPATSSDSEGLLACAELADVRGHRIALVGAPGGRGLLAPALAARGAHVEEIHAYRRVPPRLTARHFAALAGARDPLLMPVSSAAALANLVTLLPEGLLGRLREQTLVASSARLAALAAGAGFEDIVEAASAAPADLLAAAARALARHRL